MPITVYGDIPAKCWLPQDAELPKRRTLLIKLLSKNEARTWSRRRDAAYEMEDEAKRDAAYDELLKEVVVGWENMPGEFSISAISDHFTLSEFVQLLRAIPNSMALGADDLKKSASSSPLPSA